MTLKQKKFADEYIISGNYYDSALKAGYSENYAKAQSYKLLENVGIKSYIDERMKELEDKAIAKQEEVLKYLTSVLRGKSESTVVVVEGEGEGCSSARLIEKPPDEKERLRAAELLGKRYSMWTDKTDLNITVPTFVDDLPEDD